MMQEQSIEALSFNHNIDPALVNVVPSGNGFYSHRPNPDVDLYRLALIDTPRSTIFATKKGGKVTVFRRYDGSHSSGINVIEPVELGTLNTELSDLVVNLQK